MEYKLVIKCKLPGLNEYIAAERTNKYKSANIKKKSENIVIYSIWEQLRKVKITKPVYMEYTWYEPNKRRDKDNVSSFGRKVIQDALVRAGTLKNDGWKEIVGFSDDFHVDSKNPRVEVLIREV